MLTQVKHYDSSATLVLTVNYKYDAFGEEIEKTVVGGQVTRYGYDAWNSNAPTPVGNENFNAYAILDGVSSLANHYLWSNRAGDELGRIDIVSSVYTTRWTISDRLLSVRDVVDNAGTLIDSLAYDGFGVIKGGELSVNDRGAYAWTGQERDLDIGLQRHHARWYDPAMGKWISEDPLGFSAGDSNLYRYVNNRATYLNDPSGRQAIGEGQFDQGTVSFTRFLTLSGEKDIFAFKTPKTSPQSVRSLQIAKGGDIDFSKNVVIGKDATTALELLGYDTFYPVVSFGLDVRIKANFKANVDPDRYFWSQLTETVGKSNSPTLNKFLPSSSMQWDLGLFYPSTYGKDFVEMTDRPSVNIYRQEIIDGKTQQKKQTPIKANGQMVFAKQPEWPEYEAYRKEFAKSKASYEVRFITQLRRAKPNVNRQNAGDFLAAINVNAASTAGVLAPAGIMPYSAAFMMNGQLDQYSEPVGEYRWGYKIEAVPFGVTPIKPVWRRII